MKPEIKKLLILNAPYLLFVYLFDKVGQAVRLTPGADMSAKLLSIGDGFSAAFSNAFPSVHPADLLIGIAGAVIVRLAVYIKGKNAKKYRKGIEYGSARWGKAEDIKPYIDPVFQNNVLLTQTERLTMNSRPKQPKYARNKNILVIGGSGSGKTRFFVKPNLMQMHSSYVVTDPKGTVLIECGKLLQRGGYTALKAVNRIRDEIIHINRTAGQEKAAEAAKAQPPAKEQPEAAKGLPKKVKSEKGIVVEGLSNCLVKFSKCCTPVPGDEIVGFITRGYGVSVHRKDCPNADPARRSEADQGRWIKVSWGEDVNASYDTSLEVVCKDRPKLLMDISTVLSTSKVNVSGLNVQSTADGFAIFHVTISVTGYQQLDQVMRKLGQISSVMKVTRPAG